MTDTQLAEVRRGLQQPGERDWALETAALLSVEDLQKLFPELLAVASFSHGLLARCWDVLLRLPRPWLLAHLEHEAEPLLSAGTYEEYRALLTLYSKVDPGLTRRLAERALQNSDPDVQEAGMDFLRQLGEREGSTAPRRTTV